MVRKKDPSTKKNKTDYQVKHLISGLIILFFSLTALFNWGLVGSFLVNIIRLFIGETYPIFYAFLILLAGHLIIKGMRPSFKWRIFMGGIGLFFCLTSLLHYQMIQTPNITLNTLFQDVYFNFRNDLLTEQINSPIGGGMLGAAGYFWTNQLFGRIGSYVFLTLLFFITFLMTINISAKQFGIACRDFFTRVPQTFNQSIPNMNELRSLFNSYRDEEETNEQYVETDKIPEDEITHQKEVRPMKRKRSIRDIFKRREDDETIEFTREYQPVFQDDSVPELEEYDGPALNKRRDSEIILDLDYFDIASQMDGGKDNHYSKTQSVDRIHSYEANDLEADYDQDNKFDREAEQSENEPILSQQTEESSSLNSEDEIRPSNHEFEASKDISTNTPSSATQEARHWQEQANIAQHLTEDELSSQLEKANQTVKKAVPAKKKKKQGAYQLPSKQLLTKIPPVDQSQEYERINENIDKLELTFESFGVDAKVVKANLGPAVTKYEIEPAVGVKVSKIVSLADDIALALAARDVRIEAPIPGKSLIGIEVPNTQVSPVSFWEVIDPALKSKNLLEVPLGRDVSGAVCLADLSKMPHLLIAGATGSGKSVGMNVIIVSLLMKAKPEEVKLLMIDPKKVELTLYDGLPHLLAPVVTNPRKAAKALNNVVIEMERRYELFSAVSVRNIDGYNDYVTSLNKEEGANYELLPKIVVFIDELADLMLVASNEVETAIIRLAQMARAAGIHMIIATQRPSVDVITGIIKANIPSRLAFAVSSGTDSRTILDTVGAEKLLGRGDMLFQPMGLNKPVRVQGAYISDAEVERITDFIKEQREPEYDESMIVTDEAMELAEVSEDEYFNDAVEYIKDQETISISQLQRTFRIGYNRAARLIDDLESIGYVSPADGSKPRQVLIEDELEF